MRKSTLLLVIGMASNALPMPAPAAEPPAILAAADHAQNTWEQLHYQRLDDQESLDTLRHSNPRHYAIARRILASANELCNAAKSTPIPVKFDARNIACAGSLWLTSNPPKRELLFRIDDTVYSVLVTFADASAKLDRIH